MEVMRQTVINVWLTGPELMRALKSAFPHDISIQALPLNASGKGVHLTMSVVGNAGLHIVYKKETMVPSPGPIVDELDPA